MISTVTEWEFIDGMRKAVDWDIETMRALFEWLESLEDDTGENIEFDPIQLRCSWMEHDNLKAFNEDFGGEFQTIDELAEHTQVIEVAENNKILVQEF